MAYSRALEKTSKKGRKTPSDLERDSTVTEPFTYLRGGYTWDFHILGVPWRMEEEKAQNILCR